MTDRLFIKSLPYAQDSAELFSRIAGLQGAVFLDSSWPHSRSGRFDVLAALPRMWISSRDGVTEVRSAKEVQVYKNQDPFAIVRVL